MFKDQESQSHLCFCEEIQAVNYDNYFQQKALFKKNFKKETKFLFALMLIIILTMIGMFFIENDEKMFEKQTNVPQTFQTKQVRLLQQIKDDKLITFFQWLLDLVSSMVNVLKISFQLTALLFLITGLVNFWNLASIYIFLPIAVPQFSKGILVNVWEQLNQPILAFFNISLNTVSFGNSNEKDPYPIGEQYRSMLDLDVSEIAFQPLVVILITALQLLLLDKLLNYIKGRFRSIMAKASEKIQFKLEDIIVIKALQGKSRDNRKIDNLVKSIRKNQKIDNLLVVKQEEEQQEDQYKDVKKKIKQTKQPSLNEEQQSMKNIFDQNSQISSINLQNSLKNQQNKLKSRKDSKKKQVCKSVQPQTENSLTKSSQQKIMSLLNSLIKAKKNRNKVANIHNSFKRQNSSVSHWSETIYVDKFQIMSALMTSFLPIMLLPLVKAITKMESQYLKEKVNIALYLIMINIIVTFPFWYMIQRIKLKAKRIQKKAKFEVKVVKKQKSNAKANQKNGQIRKQSATNKTNFKQLKQKNSEILKKSNLSTTSKTKNYRYNSFSFTLSEESFQTFFTFLMNLSIPISIGIQSTGQYFLLINFFVHFLNLMASITLYHKKTCSGKLKKINKIIQQLVFLLYHISFCLCYAWENIKGMLLKSNLIDEILVQVIWYWLGVSIITIFAFGGLHEIIQFALVILKQLFKIIYMIIHVLTGGYDLEQIQKEIKESTKTPYHPKQQIKITNLYDEIHPQKQRKQIIQDADQPISPPPQNTPKNLSEAELDFEIQITKNEIILNQMKIEMLKCDQNLRYHQIQPNHNDMNDEISEINLAQITLQHMNQDSNYSDPPHLENLNIKKIQSLSIKNDCDDSITESLSTYKRSIYKNKQNIVEQNFPVEGLNPYHKKKVRRSYSRPENLINTRRPNDNECSFS